MAYINKSNDGYDSALGTPLTVGYYDDSRGRGGTTRYLTELIAHLDRDRFKPEFFAPARYDWHEDLTDLGVEIVTRSNSGATSSSPAEPVRRTCETHRQADVSRSVPGAFRWSLGLARETAELVGLFRSRPVDILHSNNAGAEPAPIAARLAGCPIVTATWHVDHTYDLHGLRNGLRYRALENVAARAQHGAIAVSSATRTAWARRCGLSASYLDNVRVIPNGVDPNRLVARHNQAQARRELDLPTGATIIGSIGRLDEMKGFEHLLRAVSVLNADGPPVYSVIAGTGPDLDRLQRLARELGIADRIRFTGFLPNVVQLLECVDIYVQSSLCEAFPFAVAEASGFGLPVVATAVGGVPEAIIDGVTGFLTPAKSATMLANRLGILVRHVGLRHDMGNRGRERVMREFTSEIMAARTMAFYDDIAAERIRPRHAQGEAWVAGARRAVAHSTFDSGPDLCIKTVCYAAGEPKPRISVVIPAYNSADSIGRAIESVLSQTYPAMEICVVDDGSVDHTVAAASAYSRNIMLLRQANGGPGCARNTGVRSTTGNWIALLDADDTWLPKKLEEQAVLMRDSTVGIVHSPIHGTDRAIHEETFETLWRSNSIATSSAVIRRSAFDQVGGFNESRSVISVEDYNLWLRLTAAGWRVAVCANEHIRYTRAYNSLSRQVERLACAELANLENVATVLGLDSTMVEKKRIAILEEYGRALVYHRRPAAARSFLAEPLKSAPSISRLAWWIATFIPRQPLESR